MLYFLGLGGMMMILYSANWLLWTGEAFCLLGAALHLDNALRGYRILRNPLFYLMAIQHDFLLGKGET